MTRDEIQQKVMKMAAERGGVAVSELSPETRFDKDLRYDSLDRVEFTTAVEEIFGLTVSDEEADTLQTIAHAVDLIVQKMEQLEKAAVS